MLRHRKSDPKKSRHKKRESQIESGIHRRESQKQRAHDEVERAPQRVRHRRRFSFTWRLRERSGKRLAPQTSAQMRNAVTDKRTCHKIGNERKNKHGFPTIQARQRKRKKALASRVCPSSVPPCESCSLQSLCPPLFSPPRKILPLRNLVIWLNLEIWLCFPAFP